MLAGHFGLAAIVKSREPQLPVWSLMLSAQLLDVIFVILYALGLESFTGSGYGQATIHAIYSHSLVGALIISIVAGIVAMIPWGRRNGLIIGAMVFSHWILDLIVHRMDMPILPGDTSIQVGFGLWTIPWLSAVVELALCLVGAYLYYHAAMRNAAKVERQEAKAGGQSPGLRPRALTASIVMLVLLVGTLAADVLGF
jgi:hypothetical protein